jgi:two-component system response regulator HydG
LLASFFLNKVSEELGKKIDGFDEEVMELFRQYNWPGNLREFRNVIRRAGLLSPSGLVTVNVLPWEIIGTGDHQKDAPPAITDKEELPPIRPVTSFDLKDSASHAEYETILEVLKQVRFNRSKAAAILKIDRKTLYNKIKAYETANNINVEE